MVIRGQIRKRIAQRQLKKFQKKKGRLTAFSPEIGKDAFVGSYRRVARINKKVVKYQAKVNIRQAKLSKIQASLLKAEASWPLLKQFRRWFWGWREKRISKQLAKKQRKLSTAQAKQARITQRIGAKFDYKLAKKQKKSDLAQVHLDFSLSKMARHLERYKKIVDLKASRLELLNQGMPAGNQLPANQFAELRNKITEHVQNTGGKTGAFRLLEIEHGIEQIRQLLLRNQFAPAQTRMGELIAFNENAP